MPSRPLAFYEKKIDDLMKASTIRNASLLSLIDIPPEDARSMTSFDEFSTRHTLPDGLFRGLIMAGISALMHEYEKEFNEANDTASSHKTLTDVSSKVLLACSKLQLIELSGAPTQEGIDDIKSLLESGLQAETLHPEDNFAKIVKAIANKTEGSVEWQFSDEAIESLTDINDE